MTVAEMKLGLVVQLELAAFRREGQLSACGAEAVPKTRQSAEGVAEATSLARIGVMRALNGHVERVFNPDRKETHWGKHKLKRDRL